LDEKIDGKASTNGNIVEVDISKDPYVMDNKGNLRQLTETEQEKLLLPINAIDPFRCLDTKSIVINYYFKKETISPLERQKFIKYH
jgi:hypothetical protein